MNDNQETSGAKLAVGLIVWLTQKLFEFSVVLTVALLAMTYILGMGEWTIIGERIADIAAKTPWLTLLIGTAYNVVCKTIVGMAEAPVRSSLVCSLLDIDGDDTHARDYYSRVMRLLTISLSVSYIISCVLAFALQRTLVIVLGHPIADIVVLLIAFVLPRFIVGIIAFIPGNKLRQEDPELYAAWDDLVQGGAWESALVAASGSMR